MCVMNRVLVFLLVYDWLSHLIDMKSSRGGLNGGADYTDKITKRAGEISENSLIQKP